MHNHVVDWYRQLNLTADAPLAEKRWTTAETFAKTLSRSVIIELVRLFSFVPSRGNFNQQFTTALVDIDPEFPLSKNTQELRMMAGLVMVASFAKSSHSADAFGLGLRACNFPSGRVKALQPEMLVEAENYLHDEANRCRPDDFGNNKSSDLTKTLSARGKALTDAETAGDEAKKMAAFSAYLKSVVDTIADSHRTMTAGMEQLAEESGLLWWVLAAHSDTLKRAVSELSPEQYALAAATEAAQRTVILPPPPSIGPLLARMLQRCKAGKTKLMLADYVKATDTSWRATLVQSVNVSDCYDLCPLCAVLEKTEELGKVTTALKAIPKLCPGVKENMSITPAQAAQQFYNELLFLRALDEATV